MIAVSLCPQGCPRLNFAIFCPISNLFEMTYCSKSIIRQPTDYYKILHIPWLHNCGDNCTMLAYHQCGSVAFICGFVNLQNAPEILTHWGRVTHICVSKLTITGSDNGLSPGRRQASIWTNDEILLIGPLGTNFSEIWIEIYTFSFRNMHLKMAAILSRPQCVNHYKLFDN